MNKSYIVDTCNWQAIKAGYYNIFFISGTPVFTISFLPPPPLSLLFYTICTSWSFSHIKVLEISGTWHIGLICTWPCLPQDWKLVSLSSGFLQNSTLEWRALHSVYLMLVLLSHGLSIYLSGMGMTIEFQIALVVAQFPLRLLVDRSQHPTLLAPYPHLLQPFLAIYIIN